MEQLQIILNEHHILRSIQEKQPLVFQHVSYDSRRVQPDTLFFCKGDFKNSYVTMALARGATAIVTEQPVDLEQQACQIIVTDVQKAMSLLAAAFFDYPQNHLKIVAITGTKGKTTTAYFLYQALQQPTAKKTALFSTVNTVLGSEPQQIFKSQLTTPESLDLFAQMQQAVANGMRYLIMEVSSQAYLKQRVYGLKYDVGSFLNISPDHIGTNEHPTFANYLHCKEQLLINSKRVIINAETAHVAEIYDAAKATTDPDQIYLFARSSAKLQLKQMVDFTFDSTADSLSENQITLNALSEKAQALGIAGAYTLGITGDYNEANAVDAIISGGILGFQHDQLAAGIATTKIPGRMEAYQSATHGTVYVDYAHNYASTKAVLRFLKDHHPAGKVIVVLGSPGNKGIDRRAGFGQALSEEADEVYLTTDDPAFEDPEQIAHEIDHHIDHQRVQVHFEMDRIQAIQTAIEQAGPDDLVAVLGKGQDPYQKIKGVDTPYPTDSSVVKKQLQLD
ncbi:UDP-N-acetylmuramyl-tripeptide synthetase [Fructilactobacillus florum DSM 22689 = JCM 16035]|nr:UDP-N-acetylmuramoyl-L-alanyl-D-glutamate--2,6-diaminopimelate ligase [Fructilactobacillus florum]KRM91863.1 UDP-N-acetylmuramyl-tripeptide synthetase [Fructilactobacillus florum DSM 22689 = JCM 16035]